MAWFGFCTLHTVIENCSTRFRGRDAAMMPGDSNYRGITGRNGDVSERIRTKEVVTSDEKLLASRVSKDVVTPY